MDMYHILFLHSSDGHLSCFCFLTIVNNASEYSYKFLCGHVFIFHGCIPMSGITRSCGSSMFNFLRTCQTINIFQSGCTILYSHRQFMRIPITPHCPQHLLLSVFDCSFASCCEVVSHCDYLAFHYSGSSSQCVLGCPRPF